MRKKKVYLYLERCDNMLDLLDLENIKTQKQLFDKSEVMNVENIDKYEKYLNILINKYGYEGVPPYYLDTVYVVATKNFRFRFVEISYNNDTIGVFYKYISMFGNTYIRLFREPISLQGNRDNEIKVFDILYNNNLFSKIVISDNLPKEIISKYKAFDNEYFNIVKDRCKNLESSKWKSSHGINKLKQDENIVFKINDFKIEELKELNKLWWDYRGKNKDTLFDGMLKLKTVDKLDIINILTWEYKGQLIGFAFIVNEYNGQYAKIKINKNIAITNIEINEFLEKHLAELIHYDTMSWCNQNGFKGVYIRGDINHKHLRSYKTKFYKNIINYYVLDAKDYYENIYKKS